jgi:hypothetical protein
LDGYFTSRTAFKRLERVASFLLLLDRLVMPTRATVKKKNNPYELMLLVWFQHHDAKSRGRQSSTVTQTITAKEFRQTFVHGILMRLVLAAPD